MKIKTYNVKTQEETILKGFEANGRLEAREIAMAHGLCLACDIEVENGFFVISYMPKKV